MRAFAVTLIFIAALLIAAVPTTEPRWARWVARAFIWAWAIWLQHRILTVKQPNNQT